MHSCLGWNFFRSFSSFKLIFCCIVELRNMASSDEESILPAADVHADGTPVHEIVSNSIWGNAKNSMMFLIYTGFAVVPAVCPDGHKALILPVRRLLKDGALSNLVKCGCKYVTKRGEDGKPIFCPFNRSWRAYNEFAYLFPNNFQPATLLRFIYWYAQKLPLDSLREHTGLKAKSIGHAASVMRQILTKAVLKTTSSEMLGGPGRVVCVDELFWTKAKRNKGGLPENRRTRFSSSLASQDSISDVQRRRIRFSLSLCRWLYSQGSCGCQIRFSCLASSDSIFEPARVARLNFLNRLGRPIRFSLSLGGRLLLFSNFFGHPRVPLESDVIVEIQKNTQVVSSAGVRRNTKF